VDIQLNKRDLKARSHALKPVVMFTNKGLTDAVLFEIEQALLDRELINVKIQALKPESTLQDSKRVTP
jgi:RNA-binding protein YhbY